MSQEQTSQIVVERREEKEFIANQTNNNSACASSAGKQGPSQPCCPSKTANIKTGAQKCQSLAPLPPKNKPKQKKAASAITYFKTKQNKKGKKNQAARLFALF